MEKTVYETVDDYIASFPTEIQGLLIDIRNLIKRVAPEAEESISYGMPGYKLDGKPLVYFGGFKKHIGLYATAEGHESFADELSYYKGGKGSVQFPYNRPIPLDLIRRMVAFRASQFKA